MVSIYPCRPVAAHWFGRVTGGVSIFKVAVFGNGDTSSPVWLLQQFRHRSPSLGDVEPRWTPP